MRPFFYILIQAILFSISTVLYAQVGKVNQMNEMPKTPNVNSLYRFSEVPVSHYTGVPDITQLALLTNGKWMPLIKERLEKGWLNRPKVQQRVFIML